MEEDIRQLLYRMEEMMHRVVTDLQTSLHTAIEDGMARCLERMADFEDALLALEARLETLEDQRDP